MFTLLQNLQQFLHLSGHSIPYFLFRSKKFREGCLQKLQGQGQESCHGAFQGIKD